MHYDVTRGNGARTKHPRGGGGGGRPREEAARERSRRQASREWRRRRSPPPNPGLGAAGRGARRAGAWPARPDYNSRGAARRGRCAAGGASPRGRGAEGAAGAGAVAVAVAARVGGGCFSWCGG